MNFVILPHQLFEKQHLDKKYNYLLWEHPHYYHKYNYNKKKIILHKSSMLYYYDYLKNNNFSVKFLKNHKTLKDYTLFDPIDKLDLPGNYTIINSPNFLLSKELLLKYRSKTDKFTFNNFYMWSKKQLDIIPTIKSQDKLNRNKLKQDTIIPPLPSNNGDSFYIKKGIRFTNKHFSDNYGNTESFVYPVTHITAKLWLSNFLKTKMENYGKYQDAIVDNESYLFHSVLSSSINIGLLNPIDIITELKKYKNTPLNSLEGYIRQLFWREYQVYCYNFFDFQQNYLDLNKKMHTSWYTATTNNEIINKTISKAFNTGYLHHIERLMVIGNYMVLNEINPSDGFRWFMEFSCDSYEWVMHQNVLDMVFFVSGGGTMRRPYISKSNYIKKMSNYKSGEWEKDWDNKYQKFVMKYKSKLWKFRYFINFK